ncbi:MAG: TonB-dependent receptor, partial [Bacteroidota bacterium]|nr:TonB-dependent receptor [Bacteroidota bacterium]
MKKKLLLVFPILFFSSIVFSQEITGVVLDNQGGEAMIGVTIAVKGTSTGTVTNEEGRFQLKITQQLPVTLVFSYIGYAAQEFVLKSPADLKRSFNIKLKSAEKVFVAVEIVDTRITQKQKESPLTIESMGLQQIKSKASSTFYEGLSTL